MELRCLAVLMCLLLWEAAGEGPGDFLSATEQELLSSKLWKKNVVNLFIVRQNSNPIPDDIMDYVKMEVSATVVEIACQATDSGSICSLLSQHEAVVTRRGEERGVVGIDSWAKVDNRLDYIIIILEHILGDSISRLDSHSSLISFLSINPQCFLTLVPGGTSVPEYSSLLKTFLTQHHHLPLVVTRSKDTLPLSRRPPHSIKEPPLYLYHLRDHGEQWYQLYQLHLIDKFILRSQYPVMVNLNDEKNIIKQFRNKDMHLALFFPGVPGSEHLDIRQLAEEVAEKLYLWYIIILADRIRDSEFVRRYSVGDSPQIIMLQNGMEKNVVVLDVGTEDLEMEVGNIIHALLPYTREEDVVGVLQDDEVGGASNKLPSISLTNMYGVDLIVNTTKNNLVVSFCKKGDKVCPDDVYFTLESAQKSFVKAQLDIIFHFLVVECDSVKDTIKYGINSLPTYALYNGAAKSWKIGTGNVKYYKDILATIAEAIGHKELMEISPPQEEEIEYHDDFDDFPPSLLESKNSDPDIYARLGRTMPPPSLPGELVLTDENFKERIKKAEKTAVLFYLSWSVESKVVLHHLLGAWEQLQCSKEKATLATLDCFSYTQTCSLFNLTRFPSLLLFTPSTFDTPAPPPPFVGVLDSARFLQALGQQPDSHGPQRLRELTPASLPVLLANKLTTPLVIWCADDPMSELARAFRDAAPVFAELAFSFAWINSSEHVSLLDSAFGLAAASLPTVLVLQLDQSAVYQMGSTIGLQADTFREQLITFLDGVQEGAMAPTGHLPSREWPPIQPPYHFPSTASLQQGAGEERAEFEDVGEMDMDDIPYDRPPQVMDYPAFEDQSHEEGGDVWRREEL